MTDIELRGCRVTAAYRKHTYNRTKRIIYTEADLFTNEGERRMDPISQRWCVFLFLLIQEGNVSVKIALFANLP